MPFIALCIASADKNPQVRGPWPSSSSSSSTRHITKAIFSFFRPRKLLVSASFAQFVVDAVIGVMHSLWLLADKVLHVRGRSVDNAASIRLAQYSISSAVKTQHEHLIIENLIQALLDAGVVTVARRADGEHLNDQDRHVRTTIQRLWRDAEAGAKTIVENAKSLLPGYSGKLGTAEKQMAKRAIIALIKSRPPEPTSRMLGQGYIGLGVSAARPPAQLRVRECDLAARHEETLRNVGALKVPALKIEVFFLARMSGIGPGSLLLFSLSRSHSYGYIHCLSLIVVVCHMIPSRKEGRRCQEAPRQAQASSGRGAQGRDCRRWQPTAAFDAAERRACGCCTNRRRHRRRRRRHRAVFLGRTRQ